MAAVPFIYNAVGTTGAYESGAILKSYIKETTTDQAAYTDPALATPASNPYTANAAGLIKVYLDDSLDYTLLVRDSSDAVTLFEVDYTASTGVFTVTGGTLSNYNEFTAAQINAIVTVAGNITEILTIEADLSGSDTIGLVAGAIIDGSLSTLATLTAEIEQVADIDAEIAALYAKLTEIEGVYDSLTEIDFIYSTLLTSPLAVYKTYAEMRALSVAEAALYGQIVVTDRAMAVYKWTTGNQSTGVNADEITSGQGNGGVWVAPTAAKTGASGAWRVVPTGPYINLRWYGIVSDHTPGATDGTDTWPMIEAALNYADAIGGATIYWPGGNYRIKQAIRPRNNCTILVESTAFIEHTDDEAGVNRWPNSACFAAGTYKGDGTFPTYTLDNATIGDETVTTSTASEAGNFAEGDVVLIRTTAEFTVGVNDIPVWGQVNVVTSADSGTGVIGLRRPVNETQSSIEICNISDSGTNWLLADATDMNIPAFAVRDFHVKGGHWSTLNDDQAFMVIGGMIDSSFDVDSIYARAGVAYGNLSAHNTLKCKRQVTRLFGTELAYSSHDNVVEILSDEIKDKASGTANGCVQFNEGAYSNKAYVHYLNAGDSQPKSFALCANSRNNEIHIKKAVGTTLDTGGGMIWFYDSTPSGTRPDLYGNVASIGEGRCFSSLQRYVKYQDGGQLGSNEVRDSKFYGTITDNAIELDGDEPILTNVWCEDGNIDASSVGTAGRIANTYAPDGINKGGSYWDAELYKVKCFGLITDKSRNQDQVRLRGGPISATDAAPFSKTVTLPGNSFSDADTIRIKMSALIPGSSSSSNKTFAITFDGQSVLSYVTTSTGISEVFIDVILACTLGTTVITKSVIVKQDDATQVTEVNNVASVDTTGDCDIVVSVTPTAASGDTVNIRTLSIEPYTPENGAQQAA